MLSLHDAISSSTTKICECRIRLLSAPPAPAPLLAYRRAVDARLEWAAKEMFGGKVLFPLLMATLVSAASVTLRDAPDLDKQTFCQAANRVLDHVLLQGRDAFAVAAHMGRCEALAALAVAKQHLQSLC